LNTVIAEGEGNAEGNFRICLFLIRGVIGTFLPIAQALYGYGR